MEPEYNQEEPQRNRHLLFIIVTYLLLTVSTHFSAQASSFNTNILKNIYNSSNTRNVSIQSVFSVFNSENYEGKWNTRDLSGETVLSKSEGKFTIYIKRDL